MLVTTLNWDDACIVTFDAIVCVKEKGKGITMSIKLNSRIIHKIGTIATWVTWHYRHSSYGYLKILTRCNACILSFLDWLRHIDVNGVPCKICKNAALYTMWIYLIMDSFKRNHTVCVCGGRAPPWGQRGPSGFRDRQPSGCCFVWRFHGSSGQQATHSGEGRRYGRGVQGLPRPRGTRLNSLSIPPS